MNYYHNLFNSHRINSVRGLACALLVAHHVTISLVDYRDLDAAGTLEVDAMISYLRMPAFTFISGLILGISSSTIGSASFLYRKCRRLILPYLIVSTLLVVGRNGMPDASLFVDIPHHWIYPYTHLWFLPVAFFFFVLAAALSKVSNLRSAGGSMVFLAVTFAVSFLPIPERSPFAVDNAADLVPYFSVGLTFSQLHRSGNVTGTILAVVAVIAATVTLSLIIGNAGPWDYAISTATVLCVFAFLPYVALLAWVGKYSFSIYLFHGIIVSLGIRFMPADPILAALGTGIGAIAVPVFVEVAIRRWMPIALPVIGQDRWSTKREASRLPPDPRRSDPTWP